ncbi:MAG: bifunctional nuclease family protein [Deltaproteobacteria bacterium]|nr:bifunctional nuclease family protein [Deltaproteobacteria bacterium]
MRSGRLVVLGLSACSIVGCGAAEPCPPAAPVEEPMPDPGVPPGYVRVEVLGVLPTEQGNALLLRSDQAGRVLPVFIGSAEANAIQMRLAGQRAERPMTHDLLDRIMQRLGGELVRVLVNKLRGDVFLGTVVVRRDERYFSIDARPSDAVALAVGNGCPVFVSTSLLETTGLPLDTGPGP